MADEPVVAGPAGVIENTAVLDLTGVKSPGGLDAITRIENVAALLVPEPLMARLMGIPMQNVATVVPVPEGATAKVLTGQTSMSGEALAEGDPEAFLVVVGTLLITSPVEKVGYKGLIAVGVVFAPQGSETALGAAFTRLIGEVIYHAPGGRVRSLSGTVRMPGEALANPGGSADDILVVSGQLLITSPVEKVGYRELIVAGQLVAPRESQVVLAGGLRVLGQAIYYSGTPRFFTDDDRFAKAFFELLPEPITMVLIGDYTIEPGVTAELIRAKVTEIALAGDLAAPSELVPLLQVLAVEKQGQITALADA